MEDATRNKEDVDAPLDAAAFYNPVTLIVGKIRRDGIKNPIGEGANGALVWENSSCANTILLTWIKTIAVSREAQRSRCGRAVE